MVGYNTTTPPQVFLDKCFPIGSIYISINEANPSILFGGTWEQIKDTFLMCSGDSYVNGSTGGSITHLHSTTDHTLTIDEMPNHEHVFQRQQWYSADTQSSTTTGTIYSWKNSTGGTTSYGYKGSGNYGPIGGSQGHNHGNTTSASTLPPYLAVIVWKRIQ